MLYDDAHQFFGWPVRSQVFDPKGAGASVYADEAKRKIGGELRRLFPNLAVEAGVLSADPNSDSTEAPIAVVCEFPSGATEAALKQAHRLAWNFSRTALLITLEPHRLLAWSCWIDPQQKEESPQLKELLNLPATSEAPLDALQSSARDLLHWVSLITGNYLKQQPKKFRADGRADALLLENLRVVRRGLLALGLDRGYCHDLLARIIFTQFLFHRRDSDHRPFLDKNLLDGRCDGELRHVHKSLDTILADGDETYRFFRWLDGRFNGDLFPGNENQTDAERDEAWRLEKTAVTKNPDVLKLLADFVSGSLELDGKQFTLWRQYSFDVIPLEFISSVYEEFLTEDKHKAKAYYTPPHLVDFVLDGVLPWNDDRYDLRILDPCCGSGIFLVKAFQRLIHRWRRVHKRDPLVSDLKPLLANNLWGVDRDPEAVRVACFSLYLAMADAIEPKYYLHRQKGERVFPRLRGVRLLAKDFFDEETEGICVTANAGTFDFVVGNAPWGRNSAKTSSESALVKVANSSTKSAKTKAEVWAHQHKWPIADGDFGPLFLAKGAALAKWGGSVAMIQPVSTMLYVRSGQKLRQKLFTELAVDEVVNFAAFRRTLFPVTEGSACVVILHNSPPTNEDITYIAPKPSKTGEDDQRIVIETHDVHSVSVVEARNDPHVWTALAVAGRRDYHLLKRLAAYQTLGKAEARGEAKARKGIVRGRSGAQKRQDDLLHKPILETSEFPKDDPDDLVLYLDSRTLPSNRNPWIEKGAAIDLEPFKLPELIIKKSWPYQTGRFEAALVRSGDREWGIVCTQSYVAVHDRKTNGAVLEAAWLSYNSKLAFYLLLLSSSRLGSYRPEPLVEEFLGVPFPTPKPGLIQGIRTRDDVDERIREVFDLTESEWALVEDMTELGYLDAKGILKSPTRLPTARKNGEVGGLRPYTDYFVRVLQATFGKGKAICATIFTEVGSERLPVRLAAIHLDWPGRKPLTVAPMGKDSLFKKLRQLYEDALSPKSRALSGEGLGFQRVAFLFHTHVENGRRIPSLYIIKPDQRRYWTRSLAMRDADQLAAVILRTAGRSRAKS